MIKVNIKTFQRYDNQPKQQLSYISPVKLYRTIFIKP
jgi:hypothetical protein